MSAQSKPDRRQAQLAKIHIAKKDLGLDDATYRGVLWAVSRARSAAELDEGGRLAVLEHFRAHGWRPRRKGRRHHAGAPHNIDSGDRGPQLRKIEALLAEAGRPWAYVESIARRMFRVDRLAFCTPHQLSGVTAALVRDAERHGRRAR